MVRGPGRDFRDFFGILGPKARETPVKGVLVASFSGVAAWLRGNLEYIELTAINRLQTTKQQPLTAFNGHQQVLTGINWY